MSINLTAVIDNEEAVRKFKELQKTAKTVTSSVITDSDRMDAAMRRIATTLGQIGVGASLVGLVKQIAQTRGEFQQLEVAFTTLLQSKEKADALMAQMVELAAKTPFDLQGVASGARQLLAYGFAAEDVTDTLTRLGNVAAGLGLNLQDLTWLYGTTAVQGRLYTRDVMQFQSRGIDLAGELATMLGKTRAEISQMVTEGKIGFPEVQKAIENMTNEGGKFYNLMQEQSKTITGLISNLGDAIDVMFNDIGKSQEGVITDVLKGTISLVENYQKVLDILIPLVSAYGAYKAALIVTTALQKAAVTASSIKAFFQLAKGITSAKDAMLLFNTAVKANPLGLALSILVAIGTAVYRYSNNAKEAAENTLGLARANKKASEEIASEIGRIKSLQDIVNNSNNAYSARKKALSELKGIVPDYHADLTSEGELINNNTEALKNYIKEFEKSVKLQAAKDELAEAYKQQRQDLKAAEDLIARGKAAGWESANGWGAYKTEARPYTEAEAHDIRVAAIQKTATIIKELNDEIAQGSVLIDENSSTTITSATKNLKAAQEAYDKAYSDWEKAVANGSDISIVKEKQETVETAKKALDEAKKLAGINDKTVKATAKTQQKLSDSLVQSDLDLQSRRIAIMRDGRNKRLAEIDLEYQQTAAKINQNRKESVENGATKDELSVYDEQMIVAEQKRTQDRAQVEKEYAEQTAETYRQLADVFLSEEERKVRAIERTYQAMRDKAVEDLQAGNIDDSNFALLNDRIDRAEEREIARNQLEKWQKYAQERLEIEEKFQQEVARIREQQRGQKGEAEIEQYREIRDNDLAALTEEMGMKEDEFTAIVDRIVNMGLEQILDMIPQVQEAIAALGDDIDPAVKAKLQAQLSALKRQAQNRQTGKDSDDTARKSADDWKELQEVLNGVAETFGEVGDAIGGTAGEIVAGIGGIATSTASMLNGISAIGTAVSVLEKASAVLMIISAGLKLVTGIVSLFSKSHELSEEVIQSYEAYIEVTDKLIDKQKELLETMTGVQALIVSEEGVAAIRKQEEATRELGKAYLASRAKRSHSYGVKTEERLRGYRSEIEAAGFDWNELYGSGRMEGLFDLSGEEIERFQRELPQVWAQLDDETRKYLETIVECKDKMNELEEATNEALTGISLDDARDELLDFLNDMDATFDDVAGNFENTMMNAINRVIASQMDGRLQKWYKDFSKAMDDGSLSEEEREELKREYENIYQDALRKRDEAYSIADIDASGALTQQQQSSSKGFQAMSQDTGNELNGRFSDMQGKMNILVNGMDMLRSINMATRNATFDMRDIMIQLNGNVADIRIYTRILPKIYETLTSVNRKLDNL